MIGHDLLFRAVSDATRRRLLHLLGSGEHCVGDLVEILELPQPTVSRHLAHLRRVGLVSVRRESPWVHYSLVVSADPVLAAVMQAVRSCAHDPQLQSDRARAAALAETGGCCPASRSASETDFRPRSESEPQPSR